jgi:hypothetical protein
MDLDVLSKDKHGAPHEQRKERRHGSLGDMKGIG